MLACSKGHFEQKVIDSRPTSNAIRRRRQCLTCGERFSTEETRVDGLRPLNSIPRMEEVDDALSDYDNDGIRISKTPVQPVRKVWL